MLTVQVAVYEYCCMLTVQVTVCCSMLTVQVTVCCSMFTVQVVELEPERHLPSVPQSFLTWQGKHHVSVITRLLCPTLDICRHQ